MCSKSFCPILLCHYFSRHRRRQSFSITLTFYFWVANLLFPQWLYQLIESFCRNHKQQCRTDFQPIWVFFLCHLYCAVIYSVRLVNILDPLESIERQNTCRLSRPQFSLLKINCSSVLRLQEYRSTFLLPGFFFVCVCLEFVLGGTRARDTHTYTVN